MSIFGKLDAAAIPTSPYFIEAGDYSATITKAAFQNNKKDQRQLVIEYTIDDSDSQFLDSKATQFYTLPDPDLTAEMFERLPGDEKKTIRKTLSSMKRTLCGDGRNKGLGVDENDLNDPNWNPQVLQGLKVDLNIYNYGANNEQFGIKWANLQE